MFFDYLVCLNCFEASKKININLMHINNKNEIYFHPTMNLSTEKQAHTHIPLTNVRLILIIKLLDAAAIIITSHL